MPSKNPANAPPEKAPKLYLPTPVRICDEAIDTNLSWNDAFPRECVGAILGAQGQGKTALAFRIAEYNHERRGMDAVYLDPTKAMKRLLPKWCKPIYDIDKLPEGVTVIVDEAHTKIGARDTATTENKGFMALAGMARQRGQSLLWLTHMARKIDPLAMGECKRWYYKMPTAAQVVFDRAEMKPFTARALRAFQSVKGMPQKKVYVIDLENLRFSMMPVQLPKFWTPAMSKAMAKLPVEVKTA